MVIFVSSEGVYDAILRILSSQGFLLNATFNKQTVYVDTMHMWKQVQTKLLQKLKERCKRIIKKESKQENKEETKEGNKGGRKKGR